MTDTAPAMLAVADDLGDAHHRRLERIYRSAPTNALLPSDITVAHGRCTVTMQLDETHVQAVGGVHGMFPFKVLDESAFYAAQSLYDFVFLTTASASISYLAPPTRGGVLRADAAAVHATRSSVLVEVVITDAAAGVTVSRGTATFVRTREPLPADTG